MAPENFKSYDQLQDRLNQVLRLQGEKKVETMTETLKAKPNFNDVSNMNAKPDKVEVKAPVQISAEDQPSTDDDEDVMDYFRKLADS